MTERIVWTSEYDEELETLLADENNLSFGFIAERMVKKFGLPFSKNGCIGRTHRLKFPPRPPRTVIQIKAHDPDKIINLPSRIDAPIIPKEAQHRPGDRQLTIMQLRYGDCRYPTGERPPYTYCGKPARDGKSFCPDCEKVVYHEPRQRWS